jgi:excisionase family DNA binding protein
MAAKLMKVTDVANVLNISRSQAYSMVNKGDIPSFKRGKIVRVIPEVLNQFILDNHSSNIDSLGDPKFLIAESKLVGTDTNISSEKEISHA